MEEIREIKRIGGAIYGLSEDWQLWFKKPGDVWKKISTTTRLGKLFHNDVNYLDTHYYRVWGAAPEDVVETIVDIEPIKIVVKAPVVDSPVIKEGTPKTGDIVETGDNKRGTKVKLSDSSLLLMLGDYGSGASSGALAKKYGVDRRLVMRYVKHGRGSIGGVSVVKRVGGRPRK